MEKGKWLTYLGVCMFGLFAGWIRGQAASKPGELMISFDRLYPRSPMDSVMQTAAHAWSDVEELINVKTCNNRLCEQIRSSLLSLHQHVQLLKKAQRISTDELLYIANVVRQLEPIARQAHEKNGSCCFGNIAWLLEGIHQQVYA